MLTRRSSASRYLPGGGSLKDLPEAYLPALKNVLDDYIGKSGKTILAIAELAGLSNSSMHRILKGEIHPSRNVLLRLAFVLGMSFEATQFLLTVGNRSPLSGSRYRDRAIMQGIIQNKPIPFVNDTLTQMGCNDLFSRQD